MIWPFRQNVPAVEPALTEVTLTTELESELLKCLEEEPEHWKIRPAKFKIGTHEEWGLDSTNYKRGIAVQSAEYKDLMMTGSKLLNWAWAGALPFGSTFAARWHKVVRDRSTAGARKELQTARDTQEAHIRRGLGLKPLS